VMFEAPSACLQAKAILQVADFASIGTNDLVQYLFAVDRDNELVAADYQPNQEVFWTLIAQIAQAALEAGKPLSVCGELAGNPEYIPMLMKAGITHVSVSARLISTVRLLAASVHT
ncbi:MAG: phosphoenolpyruvate--protein phosphotransferase, partial [Spartobacteria bacterium]|nr:phosphoenolpyruvate--protein phosphotransferase [Spartobacteria bacterium]